ncbi:hypothetical protein CYY_007866 [Polysphondylium violaceum]|uniref:SET domain-containing protein n=1 Tax=Polysphondylium violaceum TaxID=133409 RepID=A0A8J4PR98_9MYCE|nr:hypothetical protein CYY_007866 [Polysphondylium violaceum]
MDQQLKKVQKNKHTSCNNISHNKKHKLVKTATTSRKVSKLHKHNNSKEIKQEEEEEEEEEEEPEEEQEDNNMTIEQILPPQPPPPIDLDYTLWHTDFPIKVMRHPVGGRYLIATKDLEESSVILRDLPYTWAVDHSAYDIVCQHCFLEVSKEQQQENPSEFIICDGCNRVGYCSEACQTIDMNQHKFECQIIKRLDTNEYSAFLLSEIKLLVRTLSRKWLEQQIECNNSSNSNSNNNNNNNNNSSNSNNNSNIKVEGDNGQSSVDEASSHYSLYKSETSLIPQDNGLRYSDYAELVSNIENFDESLKNSLSFWICKYIVGLAKDVRRQEDEIDLLNILLRNRCNAFYIQGRPKDGSPGESRGCGVYVRNSFFNHSCDPNVNYWVLNNTLEVECSLLRPVKEGEELCISYIDTTFKLKKRRAKLLEGYLFHCTCQKCLADELNPDMNIDEQDDDDDEEEGGGGGGGEESNVVGNGSEEHHDDSNIDE